MEKIHVLLFDNISIEGLPSDIVESKEIKFIDMDGIDLEQRITIYADKVPMLMLVSLMYNTDGRCDTFSNMLWDRQISHSREFIDDDKERLKFLTMDLACMLTN